MTTDPADGRRQLTDDDLAGMTAHAIVAAREAGRLDVLLGRMTTDDAALVADARDGTRRLTRDDLHRLAQLGHHALIADANRRGAID